MPLTQTQLATAVADRAELSKTDAKRALAALEEVVLEQLGNAEKVRIGGMVQLAVRVKPAQKKRKGRNPATGEEITIAAKPASVDLRARPPRPARARRREREHSAIGTLTECFNGTAWTVVPRPDTVNKDDQLNAVAELSPSSAWAVGLVRPAGTRSESADRGARR